MNDELERIAESIGEECKIEQQQNKTVNELLQQINQQNKLIQTLAEKIYYLQDECNDRDDCPGTIGKQQCIDCIIKLAKEK